MKSGTTDDVADYTAWKNSLLNDCMVHPSFKPFVEKLRQPGGCYDPIFFDDSNMETFNDFLQTAMEKARDIYSIVPGRNLTGLELYRSIEIKFNPPTLLQVLEAIEQLTLARTTQGFKEVLGVYTKVLEYTESLTRKQLALVLVLSSVKGKQRERLYGELQEFPLANLNTDIVEELVDDACNESAL